MVTQRPGELDPTILSQCSTVFAMRLSNDRDQDIIRSAIPDSSASTMSFLSSIGNGEAIAFGEAVAVPMRMVFERVSEAVLPRANSGLQPVHRGDPNTVDLGKIVMRMRHIDETARTFTPPAEPVRQQPASVMPQMPSIDPGEDFGAAPAMRRTTDTFPGAPAADQGYASQAGDRSPEYRPAAPAAPTADRNPEYHRPAAPAAPRHELTSLRSSLLKKPLSSLLKD